MIETYEKEVDELIKKFSSKFSDMKDVNDFSRLCWLIGCMQGQLMSIKSQSGIYEE